MPLRPWQKAQKLLQSRIDRHPLQGPHRTRTRYGRASGRSVAGLRTPRPKGLSYSRHSVRKKSRSDNGLRVARGLFRLWLVFSVLWVAGIGAAGLIFDEPVGAYVRLESMSIPASRRRKLMNVLSGCDGGAPWLALIPPIVVLVIGWVLTWAFRGFLQEEEEL